MHAAPRSFRHGLVIPNSVYAESILPVALGLAHYSCDFLRSDAGILRTVCRDWNRMVLRIGTLYFSKYITEQYLPGIDKRQASDIAYRPEAPSDAPSLLDEHLKTFRSSLPGVGGVGGLDRAVTGRRLARMCKPAIDAKITRPMVVFFLCTLDPGLAGDMNSARVIRMLCNIPCTVYVPQQWSALGQVWERNALVTWKMDRPLVQYYPYPLEPGGVRMPTGSEYDPCPKPWRSDPLEVARSPYDIMRHLSSLEHASTPRSLALAHLVAILVQTKWILPRMERLLFPGESRVHVHVDPWPATYDERDVARVLSEASVKANMDSHYLAGRVMDAQWKALSEQSPRDDAAMQALLDEWAAKERTAKEADRQLRENRSSFLMRSIHESIRTALREFGIADMVRQKPGSPERYVLIREKSSMFIDFVHPLLEETEWLLAAMFPSILHGVTVSSEKVAAFGARGKARRQDVPATARIILRRVAVLFQLMTDYHVTKDTKGDAEHCVIRNFDGETGMFESVGASCIGRDLTRDSRHHDQVPTGRGVAMTSVPVSWKWLIDMGAKDIGKDLEISFHTKRIRENLKKGLTAAGVYIDSRGFFSTF